MFKILIVDDDIEVLRSLGNTFTTTLKGYLILTATTANQGLNLIKEQKPDIIIMDVRLGPASGMDLLEDYSNYIQDYHPRLIVITAYDDEEAKKKAEKLHVDAFLLKPFSKENLLSAAFSSIEKYFEAELRSVRFAAQAFRAQAEAVQRVNEELKEKFRETQE